MLSLYPNLPGFRTELQDRNLKVEETVARTQKIVIMGTATDGPVGQPVEVSRPEDAEAIFGRAVDDMGRPNGATLLPKFYEVYYAGARNIALMRISGDVAANSLAAAGKSVVRRHEAQDKIGAAKGNNESVFNIPDLKPGDKLLAVNIIANGQELPSSSFEFDDQSVKLLEDRTDSNADIAIEFSFLRNEPRAADRKILQAINTDYETFQSPDGEINWDESANVTVWVNGAEADPDGYIVDFAMGQITFDNALESGDVVEARFTYLEQVQIDDFVTGLTAVGSPQVLKLAQKPVFTTFRLYAGGYEMDKEAYLLNAADSEVTLLPGHAPNGATLVAVYEYESSETIFPSIRSEGVNAGAIYNNVLHKVDDITAIDGSVIGKKVTIIKPESKKTSEFESALEYSSLDYPTFGELVRAVNEDPRNNVVRFSTEYPKHPTAELFTVSNMYLSGGKDGLNLSKAEIYEKLGGKRDARGEIVEYGAYQLLENYDGDIYIPAGVYADDNAGSPTRNFGDQLAQFCAVQTLRNNECRGVIPVRPPVRNDLPSVVARVQEIIRDREQGKFRYYLRNLKGEYMRDNKGRRIDIGRHIDLVFMTGRVSNELLGVYSASLDGMYAGLQASISSASDTTEKVLPGVLALDFNLSAALHDKLSEAGIVTFYTDPNRGVVVVNGITAADNRSDYRSLPNIRIALEASRRVREVSKRYMGEPYNLIKKNAHTTDIQAELDSMVDPEGKLTDFTFSIHQSVKDRILHNAVIMLDIVPAFALKSISMPVSLRPSL